MNLTSSYIFKLELNEAPGVTTFVEFEGKDIDAIHETVIACCKYVCTEVNMTLFLFPLWKEISENRGIKFTVKFKTKFYNPVRFLLASYVKLLNKVYEKSDNYEETYHIKKI